jgi:hypothetical protein
MRNLWNNSPLLILPRLTFLSLGENFFFSFGRLKAKAHLNKAPIPATLAAENNHTTF